MPGAYSQAMRAMMLSDDHRDVLDLWANDCANAAADWIQLDYIRDPGSATACHNVANTLVDKAGTGALTTLVSGVDAMAPSVANVLNGGFVMEIKFHDDHSVLLISTLADPNVEILEGWAGGGVGLGGNVIPYRFTRSVYEDHELGRKTKAIASNALHGAVTGVNLAQNVGRLTRCVAGACGIHHIPFRVTVKMKALAVFGTWQLTTQNEITAATTRLARVVYDDLMPSAHPVGLRCGRCFNKYVFMSIMKRWHSCAPCHLAYCQECGALQPEAPAASIFDRTRRTCPGGHVMDII